MPCFAASVCAVGKFTCNHVVGSIDTVIEEYITFEHLGCARPSANCAPSCLLCLSLAQLAGIIHILQLGKLRCCENVTCMFFALLVSGLFLYSLQGCGHVNTSPAFSAQQGHSLDERHLLKMSSSSGPDLEPSSESPDLYCHVLCL